MKITQYTMVGSLVLSAIFCFLGEALPMIFFMGYAIVSSIVMIYELFLIGGEE